MSRRLRGVKLCFLGGFAVSRRLRGVKLCFFVLGGFAVSRRLRGVKLCFLFWFGLIASRHRLRGGFAVSSFVFCFRGLAARGFVVCFEAASRCQALFFVLGRPDRIGPRDGGCCAAVNAERPARKRGGFAVSSFVFCFGSA